MRIYHRPYDEQRGDFPRIWRYLLDDYTLREDAHVWLTSRFGDWKYGLWSENKYFPPFFRENCQLWLNDLDELLGFAISESGDSMFTIFTRPSFDGLYAEILSWVMAHWNDRGEALCTEIHEFQPKAAGLLAQAGFVQRELAGITYQYCLAEKAAEPVLLEPGFRIVDCLEDRNYASKRRVQRSGFVGTDTVRPVDMLAYAYSRECPAYDPRYDLSVIDAQGQHVASCLGFVDIEHHVAEIERVCTHSDYRKRGFAKAVIRACFQRLAAGGYHTAYITGMSDGPIRLYNRLGAVREKKWFRYEAASQAEINQQ